MGNLKRTWQWLDEHFEETVLVLLLVAITLLTGTQVVMRRILQSPLSWSEELCRYCFMWTGFISVAYCVRKRCAIRINTFVMLLPGKGQKVLEILTNALCLLLYGAFFLASTTIVEKTLASGQASPAMRIPFYIIYMGPILGFGLSVLRLVQCIAEDSISLVKIAPEAEKGEPSCR